MRDPVSIAEETIEVPLGPWNPGIQSPIPRHLLPLATLFRPENVYTSLATAEEISGLTGLDPREVVAFRPQRLALHELLVHVTGSLSVPDGAKIEDLGINFREITRTILARYIEPQMPAISAAYDAARRALSAQIRTELDGVLAASAHSTQRPAKSRLRSLFSGVRARASAEGSALPGAIDGKLDLVNALEHRMHTSGGELETAVLRALGKVLSALLARHGSIWGSPELISSVATDIACNDLGSRTIARVMEPLLAQAAAREGYRVLPKQERPVVMNTKGPSASGKSSIRPLQRVLAGDIGVTWSDFALISPDIWRKQLLDYATLGPRYKYAGPFTADEVRIVDEKLDQYMADKARHGEMPHMLIDRFRFDSFALDSDEAGSNLLTRFGQIVYLFFVITPPASLVERAWNRGLELGRYKAVDDLLAHSVEAYSGMPQLFFTWIQRRDKRVHFEFLDNSVRFGERPRTVAFGWNDTLNVLDVKGMLDIERFRRVNLDAEAPEHLYQDGRLLDPAHNTGFIKQSVGRFRETHFADQASGRIYLRIAGGNIAWVDPEALERAIAQPDTRAGLLAVAPALLDRESTTPVLPAYLPAAEKVHTVGTWGRQ